MDIISYSKASKALRDSEHLDEKIIEKEAEAHFKTIALRLNWIEGQAEKAVVENSIEVDFMKGEFYQARVEDDRLELESVGANNGYMPDGFWLSEVIDLGSDWIETLNVTLQSNKPSNTDLEILVASSANGESFTSFSALNGATPPQRRYVKLKINMSSTPQPGEVHHYAYDQSSGLTKVVLNDFTEAEGSLQLKAEYEYDMTEDDTWTEEGSLHRQLIKATDFIQINSLEIG